LRDTTCEAQRLAVAIADRIGGVIDWTASPADSAAALALQQVGQASCTLGEVANRADLVLFWGADPIATHPRLFERCRLREPPPLSSKAASRTCAVVDSRKTETARLADLFAEIRASADFESLWVLRCLAKPLVLDEQQVREQTGVPLAVWQELLERMKHARYGVVFFGEEITKSPHGQMACEALFALVRDLNAQTRFACIGLRSGGNLAGAENVLAWQTGYPLGVNLVRGFPRYGPSEYSAARTLARGEPDAALVVGARWVEGLDAAAQGHLRSIPTVVLDSEETELARTAAVAFRTAVLGIHTAGTVYRFDHLPLPLRPVLTSRYPKDDEVLREIERRVTT
jgi:formylmethanofuran dehydrogenase subunit B